MNFKAFLAEIQTDFNRDFESGLIDEDSVHRWVVRGLRKFGEDVMTLQDTIVYIENGKGRLPDNFSSLYVALKCEPNYYHVKGDESELLASKFWTERTETRMDWDICNPECVDESETKIVEQLFYDKTQVNFHYKNPVLLKLGKNMKRSICASKCLNKFNCNCPHEISISGNILYTNFPDGVVYLQYYGMDVDEEGYIVVPDTDKQEVEEYLEYVVKRKIYENKIANDDDRNSASLLQYYRSMEIEALDSAKTAIKFQNLTPRSFDRLKAKNRKEILKYECMFPETDTLYYYRNPYYSYYRHNAYHYGY